jgi:hypothetical protein
VNISTIVKNIDIHGEDECWPWLLSKTKDGYGKVKMCQKTLRAHRVSYCHFNGKTLDEIEGQIVLHSCDNPACCNPKHLSVGTVRDNNLDTLKKGRAVNPSGSKHWKSLDLSKETLEKIRGEPGSLRSIAKKYGISHGSVFMIKQKRRSHLV